VLPFLLLFGIRPRNSGLMKKIWLFRSKTPEAADAKKLAKISGKLKKVSQRVEKTEIQKEIAASVVPAQTKVTVNLKGHLRPLNKDGEHMSKIRAMRRFYNKQMPVLHCSACAFSSTCPQFKAGYKCAFLPFLNSHRIESEKDLIEAMKEVAGVNMRRMHLATLMETLSGGMPSFETTEALTLTFQQMAKLHEITSKADEASFSIETNDNSVVNRIFGGFQNLLNTTQRAKEQPITVDLTELIPQGVDKELNSEDSSKDEVDQELVREHTQDELEKSAGLKFPVVSVSKLVK
jgi:hypothetical protein